MFGHTMIIEFSYTLFVQFSSHHLQPLREYAFFPSSCFYCGWVGHVCRSGKKKELCAVNIDEFRGNSGAFQFGVSDVFIETGRLLGTHIIYILIHIHGRVQCSEMTLLGSALVWVIIIILPIPTYTHVRRIDRKSAACCR